MRPLTILAMLLVGAAFVALAHGQEPPPPRPNLLLEMSRPQSSMPVESSMRDDIRARTPGPRAPDPFGDSFRVSVGVGDARCFPGEDNLIPERLPSGARRRMR